MKQLYILAVTTLLFLNTGKLKAQTIWTGPKTTFTKVNNTDWTLEANQDRITNNVWITRANNSTLFNIVNESTAGNATDLNNLVPTDTEWAYGTTQNYATLTYQGFVALITGTGFSAIVNGQDMVLHLISDNIYIDIKFTSWTAGGGNSSGGGGGFSYERSTDQNLSTNEFELSNKVTLFPNPSREFIQFSGLTKAEHYKIYNVIGTIIYKGTTSNNEIIDLRKLTKGLYFLKFDDGGIHKFIKE